MDTNLFGKTDRTFHRRFRFQGTKSHREVDGGQHADNPREPRTRQMAPTTITNRVLRFGTTMCWKIRWSSGDNRSSTERRSSPHPIADAIRPLPAGGRGGARGAHNVPSLEFSTVSYERSMSGRQGGEALRFGGCAVAAATHRASRAAAAAGRSHRRAHPRVGTSSIAPAPIADERLRQPTCRLRAAAAAQRVAAVVADISCIAVPSSAPGMRPAARPARWSDGIRRNRRRALARLRPDQRRARIVVAEPRRAVISSTCVAPISANAVSSRERPRPPRLCHVGRPLEPLRRPSVARGLHVRSRQAASASVARVASANPAVVE